MLKRVAVYIKQICISDGMVLNHIPGMECQYIVANNKESDRGEWKFKLRSDYMQPKQAFNVSTAEKVKIEMVTKDEDSNTFYDIGETIMTDKLTRIRVRGFIPTKVYDFDKNEYSVGIVLADLEY